LFVAEGARVVVADILPAAAAGPALFVRCDVTRADDWSQVVAAGEAAFGPISVLINNAAVLHTSSLMDTTEADFRRVIDVNQLGVLLGMQAVVPSMRRASGGSIVNTSSIAGMQGMRHLIAYGASKWAVRGMTKTAALELASDGIRVNSIHPGAITTDMNPSGSSRLHPPLGRDGCADEVAQLMCYLASDESSYTTGAEHVIDAGLLAG
jgi:3alpha(or 20beta)-hydroxysteroid dehydrogenase